MTDKVTIRQAREADYPALRRLILAGLEEHWGTLDPRCNLDLENMQQAYAGAAFLVASQGGELLGCGALIPRGEDSGEVVRMSVRADLRRSGLGTRLLQALVAEARRRGMRRIILETTSTWTEVVSFYLRNGFRITHHQDGDTWFILDL